MLALNLNQVRLNAKAQNKHDAIEQVARLLVDSGNIDPRYIESMFAREQVANTYLCNGIAIPHGMPENREFILNTGISVLQIPEGVQWNDEDTVYLLVGIAAKSNEHLDILRKLTRVVSDEEEAQRLAQTSNPADIIEALTGARPEPAPVASLSDYPLAFETTILNPTGLHARPATELVSLAKKFQSSIRLRFGEEIADAKSLVKLLQLGVVNGAQIKVSAQGVDAEQALAELKSAIESGLGEGDEHEEAPAVVLDRERLQWHAETTPVFASGVAASDGIVYGPITQHTAKKIVVEDVASDATSELIAFDAAVVSAHQALQNNYQEVKNRLGSKQAAIFLAHAEFLQDDELIDSTKVLIEQKHSAAWAWQHVIDSRIAQITKLDDAVLAARAVDLSDVAQRVLRQLLHIDNEPLMNAQEPSVLVADDLTPSDTANLDPDMILGFITAKGGPTSHTAIIARAMGIPAIVAAGDAILDIAPRTPCILDGFNGALYLKPTQAEIASAQALHEEVERQLNIDFAERLTAAVTSDGQHIEVFANVNRVADAEQAVEYGAEGVGLMRTEFLFLESGETPSEEEQYEVYCNMAKALKGHPLTIRTLDIGGDKQVPRLNLPKEDNSFLGIRGIRLCMARPDLFEPQLRAIYRAAKDVGNIRVMFPMISTVSEIEQVIAQCEAIRAELNAPKIELGIMVEVPSTAVMADQFAKLVDFFSIGTNDLTQYTLAMDRVHPQLAKQADALNPAVLRMIDMTVRAAKAEGKWVGVCGGAASDVRGAEILAGLGVTELSITVPTIPTIKAQLRRVALSDLHALAQKALACRTADEVRAL